MTKLGSALLAQSYHFTGREGRCHTWIQNSYVGLAQVTGYSFLQRSYAYQEEHGGERHGGR